MTRGHAPAPLRHGKSDGAVLGAVRKAAIAATGGPLGWVDTGQIAAALGLSEERTRKYVRALALTGALKCSPELHERYLGAAKRQYRCKHL